LPVFPVWFTFPNFFVIGDLMGGGDITVNLLKSGNLEKLLAEAKKNT